MACGKFRAYEIWVRFRLSGFFTGIGEWILRPYWEHWAKDKGKDK
jgi:hypothetical protein